jgi:hypothetical protein
MDLNSLADVKMTHEGSKCLLALQATLMKVAKRPVPQATSKHFMPTPAAGLLRIWQCNGTSVCRCIAS